MLNIVSSNKSVQEVIKSIKEVASKYGFGIQYIHNIKDTLKAKGKDIKEECQIIDICNPDVAFDFLSQDINISSILPCKITVYTKNGETFIIINSLIQLVDDINPDLIETASKAQENLLNIIEEAK